MSLAALRPEGQIGVGADFYAGRREQRPVRDQSHVGDTCPSQPVVPNIACGEANLTRWHPSEAVRDKWQGGLRRFSYDREGERVR